MKTIKIYKRKTFSIFVYPFFVCEFQFMHAGVIEFSPVLLTSRPILITGYQERDQERNDAENFFQKICVAKYRLYINGYFK